MPTKAKKIPRAEVQCNHCCKMFNPDTVEGASHLAGCKKYNGHTNYETWLVALWLGNEEPSDRHWREVASECDGADDHNGMSVLTAKERAVYELAKRLKDEVTESVQSAVESSGLTADLLNAALSEVDWDSIAEGYLER